MPNSYPVPQIGSPVYQIGYSDGGIPVMLTRNLIGASKNGWYRYRDLSTGYEWSERGWNWHNQKYRAFELEMAVASENYSTAYMVRRTNSDKDYLKAYQKLLLLADFGLKDSRNVANN